VGEAATGEGDDEWDDEMKAGDFEHWFLRAVVTVTEVYAAPPSG
jgi:hypothetical protein